MGAIASVILSFAFRFSGIEALTAIPFMNRMLIIFALSPARPAPEESNRIPLADVDFHTTPGFNLAAVLILALLYGMWWSR